MKQLTKDQKMIPNERWRLNGYGISIPGGLVYPGCLVEYSLEMELETTGKRLFIVTADDYKDVLRLEAALNPAETDDFHPAEQFPECLRKYQLNEN